MKQSNSFSRRAGDFLAGKGFYIVLILCVAVIGASAWAMLRSNAQDQLGIPVIGEVEDFAQLPPSLPTIATPMPVPTPSPRPAESNEPAEEIFFTPREETPPEETEAPTEEPVEAPASTPAPPAPAPQQLQFVWPVSGEVEVPHSLDQLIWNRTMGDFRTHAGIDIRAELGETVLAIAQGTVSRIWQDDMLGTALLIDHGDGLHSLYANLSEVPIVEEGQWVSMGTPIGAVGRTALAKSGTVHTLHLEIIDNGQQVDPLNFLPAR